MTQFFSSLTASTSSNTRVQNHDNEPIGLKRVVLASMAGSFIEWFEFSVYGYLAAIMGQVFFSAASPTIQLVASFSAFAIAFFARPVGGAFCGVIGDRLGRKKTLNFTLTLMAVATVLIGCIPGYGQIGIAAPVLLILMRLLQGFSAGGEASGAAIFVAEHCKDSHRTLMTSWLEVGSMAGFAFGAVLVAILNQLLTHEQMVSWGWRLPFFLAAPLGFIGLYIRNKLSESRLFKMAHANDDELTTSPWQVLGQLKHYPRPLLQSAALIIVTNITLFTVSTYLPSYLTSSGHLPKSMGSFLTIAPMLLLIVLIPCLAWVADRIGRKPMMLMGSIGVLVFAVPCFRWLETDNLTLQLTSLVILNLCLAAMLACIFSKVPSLFPLAIRFTGMAVSYNVAVALFAGTAPMLNTWLIYMTGNKLMPAFYLMFGAVVGIIGLLTIVDKTGAPMEGD